VQLANLSMPLEGLASSRGFQPQNKPPVHTGGFDCPFPNPLSNFWGQAKLVL